MNQQQKAVRLGGLSILLNILMALGKGIAGVFGNSYALIADAVESSSDIIASTVTMLGMRYAIKPADKNHPYGHGRAEPLITFLITGFLIASAALIAWQSILHIRTPHKTPAAYTLIVLVGVIILKEIFYRFIHKKSTDINSSAMKAEAWHHRSDAITSLAAFIGISIAIVFGPGYESADDWAALFASGIIVYNAYCIFRPALGEIMDEQVY